MKMSQLRRAAVLTVTAASLAVTSACFGSFNATRSLWKFNRDVSKNKFAQEVVFLALNIVPVYGVVGLVDAVALNTVEFWTGKNPMTVTQRLDGKHVVQTVIQDKDGQRTMVIKAFDGKALDFTTTAKMLPGTDEMSFTTIFANGRTVSRVIGVDNAGKAYVVSNSDSSP